jgi:hypothetical protein
VTPGATQGPEGGAAIAKPTPNDGDLDNEKTRQRLLEGGRRFLERIRGWGGSDYDVRPADLLDLPDAKGWELSDELDDEALLEAYRIVGGDFPIPLSVSEWLTGAEMLAHLRDDRALQRFGDKDARRAEVPHENLLPHIYARLKFAFQLGGPQLARLLREIADSVAPRDRGQPSRLNSDGVRRMYLSRASVYGEVYEEYRRDGKLPPAELLPVIQIGSDDADVLTIDDPGWPRAAARAYVAAFWDVSPHTVDRHVKRSKAEPFKKEQ